MLSAEQVIGIKNQIIKQIESTFPAEQIPSAKNQVESMNAEQLENFIKRNNLISEPNSKDDCVFCSIASDKIHSVKIDENEKAIAVLEINPISKGHAIIIPKEHAEQAGKKVLALVEKVSKNIKEKLKPEKIEIENSRLFGHETINILPIYKDETFNSKRTPAKQEELEMIKDILKEKPKPETIKKPTAKKLESKNFWLPRRIP